MAYNILAVFSIKHSDIPERKLELYETRQVDVAVGIVHSINYPDCKMKPHQNHDYPGLMTDENPASNPTLFQIATYFVKKRLTVQPRARAHAKPIAKSRGRPTGSKRFQFIATRKPIDPIDLLPHINPDDDRPNEFPTQLASIYCENAKVDKLTLHQQGSVGLPETGNCGIEQYLVGLCFLDDDVNQINRHSYQLDMDQVFSHYGKGKINDVGNVRAQVEGHCDQVIEVHMPGSGSGPRAQLNAKRLRAILQGARYAAYNMLIWYEHRDNGGPDCDRMWKWGSSLDWIRKGDAEFLEFYQISSKYRLWYFCGVDISKEATIVGQVPHGYELTV